MFDGVPQAEVSHSEIAAGLDMVAILSGKTGFIGSNSEARRALKENSISINKEKVAEDYTVGEKDMIDGKFILLQRGKKNYFVVKVV